MTLGSAFNRAPDVVPGSSEVGASRFVGSDFKRMFKVGADTSDDDSDGEKRPRRGDGMPGLGQPITVKSAGKRRGFVDGCGLCSPGR